MPRLLQRTARRSVEWMMRRSLRRAFSEVGWVGPKPRAPAGTRLVCYANHHTFFDGYLLWLLVTQHLGRPAVVWMRDWDQFPFFGAAGALPFPPDDAGRRASTLRATARFLEQHDDGVLVLFPEGEQHPPEEGVLEFSSEAAARLDRLLPPHVWWPVAIHTSWRAATRPVALLAGGAPHDGRTADQHVRLAEVWHELRRRRREPSRLLLEGRDALGPQWDLSILRSLFEPRL